MRVITLSIVISAIFLCDGCTDEDIQRCDDCYQIQMTSAIGDKTGIKRNCDEQTELLTSFEKELLNFPDSIGFIDMVDTSVIIFDSTKVDNPYDSEVSIAPNPVRRREARISFLSNAALIKICITDRCYNIIYQYSLNVNTESGLFEIEFPVAFFNSKELYKFLWRIADHYNADIVIEGYNDIWICPEDVHGGRPVEECF